MEKCKETYKEKQKKYKSLYENRVKIFWYSKDPTNKLAKGSTYVKPLKKMK